MARRDYLPLTDAGLLAFTANFSTIINVSYASFNIPLTAAAGYAAKQADYAAKLEAATEPTTRGKRTVFLKDEARKSLVALTRTYAQQINKLSSVTNDQRQALGLTIPSGERHPAPVPTTSPFIQVVKVVQRNVTIELRQASNRRGRPSKVAGATIFTATGTIAPTAVAAWTFIGSTTKTTFEVPFPPSATGDTVWITAFWKNSRDEAGYAANPVSVNLPAGGILPAEAEDAMTIKKAA